MSAYAALAEHANQMVLAVHGDAITIDATDGIGVVTPDTDMAIGGGVQLINGAYLVIRASDFPAMAVNSSVLHGDVEYIVMELDAVDGGGMRRARMARK